MKNDMDRKTLIQRYLDADATPAEERALADSFAADPPADDREAAVAALLGAVRPLGTFPLPEAEEEYDRIMGRTKRRTSRVWGLSLVGVAAVAAAVVLFTGRPSLPAPPDQNDTLELIERLTSISSSLNPSDAESVEFTRIGDGFVMTAHFPDGQTASYLVAPMDGGSSFDLISLKQ